jgi:hypothetical protein
MKSASFKTFCLLIPLLIWAWASTGQAAKIPREDIGILIWQNHEYDQNLTSRIAVNIERELRGRGYLKNYSPYFNRVDISNSDTNLVSITIYKSQWRTERAFSIPFVLNRLKRVYEIEVFLEFRARDGKKIAERMNFSQDMGVQAQVMTNDPYDPDLFPDQSSRLAVEDIVIRRLARGIADRLGAKLS